MKILFVCNIGQNRSRTAEDLFKDKFETKSAGIYSDANPLTQEKLEWADLIVVMEHDQEMFIEEHFPKIYDKKQIVCWEIINFYPYGDERLKEILKEKMEDMNS